MSPPVWIRSNDGFSRLLAIQAKNLYPDGNCKARNHRTPSGAPSDRPAAVLHEGRRAGRRGDGGGSHRPPCAPLPYRQHPGQQLPDEGSSEPAAVRLGSTQEKSRRVIAGSNGDRSGDTRPLWITGLSPPDSWRSLRQPGYLQLDQVRTPKHCVWGYDRTLKVRNFRSTKVGNFQSQLTAAVRERTVRRGWGLNAYVCRARGLPHMSPGSTSRGRLRCQD